MYSHVVLPGGSPHPVLQELLQLRARWFERIENDGGAEDVWGTWHAIRRGTDCAPGERARLARHVAATVVQSIEMEIIAPIFDIARSHGDTYQFGIVLFQHDGATISFRAHGKRKEKAMTLLRDAVETRARELGVQTTLEFADLEATAAPVVAPARGEVVEEAIEQPEGDPRQDEFLYPTTCDLCGEATGQELWAVEDLPGYECCDPCLVRIGWMDDDDGLAMDPGPAFPKVEQPCLFL